MSLLFECGPQAQHLLQPVDYAALPSSSLCRSCCRVFWQTDKQAGWQLCLPNHSDWHMLTMYLYEMQLHVLRNTSQAVTWARLSPLEKQAKRDNAMSPDLTHLGWTLKTHAGENAGCWGGKRKSLNIAQFVVVQSSIFFLWSCIKYPVTHPFISRKYFQVKNKQAFLSIKGRSASCVSCAFSVFLAFHKYVCVNSLKRSLRFIPRPKIKPVAEWTGLAQTPESQSEPLGLTCNPGITTGSTWNNEPSDRMQQFTTKTHYSEHKMCNQEGAHLVTVNSQKQYHARYV